MENPGGTATSEERKKYRREREKEKRKEKDDLRTFRTIHWSWIGTLISF